MDAKDKSVLAVIKYKIYDNDPEYKEALIAMMLNRIESVITKNGFNRNISEMVDAYITIPIYYQQGMEDRFRKDAIETLDAMFDDLENNPDYRATLLMVAKCGNYNFEVTQIQSNAVYLKLW